MRWKRVFETGIKMGLDSDIRNIDDPGSYAGTYADCRIIHGDEDTDVNNLYIAVDAGVSEMLLVNELNKKIIKQNFITTTMPSFTGPDINFITGAS